MGHEDALCCEIAYAASEHLKVSMRKINFSFFLNLFSL